VDNLWKNQPPVGNFCLPELSTDVHSPLLAALAEMWKTFIQIAKNKQLTLTITLCYVWKSFTAFPRSNSFN